MGQPMNAMPPGEVSAVLCGALHGPCLSYAATQECHTLVKRCQVTLQTALWGHVSWREQQVLREGTGFLPLIPKITYWKKKSTENKGGKE